MTHLISVERNEELHRIASDKQRSIIQEIGYLRIAISNLKTICGKPLVDEFSVIMYNSRREFIMYGKTYIRGGI